MLTDYRGFYNAERPNQAPEGRPAQVAVMVDWHRYYIVRPYAGQGLVQKRIEFQDYLRMAAEEARFIEQHWRRQQRRHVSE